MTRPVLSACLIAALAFVAPVLGQSKGAKLDENGEWLTTSQPVEGSDEWTISRARQDLADDRPAAAWATIDNWIKAHDLKLGTTSPLMAEALLIRGDALTTQGDEYDALYDYERVIKEFNGTEAYVTAVERELDIGVRYLGGLYRRFLGVRMLDSTDIGEELLIRVQERLPGSRVAERAGIELADYYYQERNLSLSATAYELFLENYRNSQYTMKAMQRRVYATIAQYKGPKYDGSKLIDAQLLVKRFESLYPSQAHQAGLDEALMARLDESAALSKLESAKWYMDRGDWPGGRYALRRLIEDHPQTAAAKTAMDLMEQNHWSLATPKKAEKPEVAEVKP